MTKHPRWSPLCLDCWQAAQPDQYAPEGTGFDTCTVCGYDALIVNVPPVMVDRAVRAAWAQQRADDAALYRVETRSGSGY